jgi:hypothetical protein
MRDPVGCPLGADRTFDRRLTGVIPSGDAGGMISLSPARRRTRTALVFAAFSVVSCAQSQPATTEAEIVTDRPDVTESSIVVPKGNKRNGVWESTFYIEREITKSWDAFTEYAGDFAQQGGPKEIAHFGSAYRLDPRQEIDFHFGFGVSRSAPEHFFAVGYSFRIDKLWGQ